MSAITDARVPWGKRDDRIVHVSELETTERGLACNCTCPHCGDRLQARLGDVRAHHFSHVSGRSCDGNRETALHALAKEILTSHRRLKVPSARVYAAGDCMELFRPQYLNYEAVLVEQTFDGFRPDVVLVRPGGKPPLLVEVAVTHFVEEEKLEQLEAAGHPCIEIDLRRTGLDFHEFDRTELERLVVDEWLGKQWLCIPDADVYEAQLEEKVRARREREAQAERARLDREVRTLDARRNKVAQILSSAHQTTAAARRDEHFAGHKDWPLLREKLQIKEEGNVPHYLNHPVAGEHLFSCNRVIWQSSVFLSWVYRKRLPGREPDIPIWHVADNFMKHHRDLLESDLVFAKKDAYTGPRLQDVFSEYFSFLEQCGFVEAVWGDGRGTKVFKCVRPQVIIIPPEYNSARYLPLAGGLFDTESSSFVTL